jgi:hypothetical protein
MKINDESGSAIIEFVVFGLVTQLAVLLFAGQILGQQKAQIAAATTARQAARAATISARAGGVANLNVIRQQQEANFNLEPGQLALSLRPANPQAGDLVTATASIDGSTSSATMRVPRS